MRETWQSIAQRFEETGIITAAEKAYVQYEFHRVWEEFQRYIPLIILHQHWKRSIWLAAFYALPAPEPVLLLPAPQTPDWDNPQWYHVCSQCGYQYARCICWMVPDPHCQHCLGTGEIVGCTHPAIEGCFTLMCQCRKAITAERIA